MTATLVELDSRIAELERRVQVLDDRSGGPEKQDRCAHLDELWQDFLARGSCESAAKKPE